MNQPGSEDRRGERADGSMWGQEAVFSLFMGLMALLGRGNPLLRFPDVLWAFGALLLFNGLYHWVLRRSPGSWQVSFLSVSVNSLLVSLILSVSGGRESDLWPMYLLPIFTACLRLERRHVFWAVAVPAGFLSLFYLEPLWRGDALETAELTVKLAVLAFSGGVTMRISFRERAVWRALEESRRRLEDMARRPGAGAPSVRVDGNSLGSVLHHLQNPLAVILGSAELLKKGTREGSPQRGDVDRILAATQDAARVTAGLVSQAWEGRSARPAVEAADASAPEPLKILVVDDEPGLRDIAERFLKGAGYRTGTAESGDAAVGRLSEGWDIVLSDIDMPGELNGNAVVKRVRAATSADVILMTAYPDIETVVQALRDGAYDYLMKPFNQDTLLAAVQRCAERRRLSRELAREKALRAELEKAERVKEVFGQFVTPAVARFVLEQTGDFWRRGTRTTLTVLFADVRRFTPFAGEVSPEEVVEALNEIFSRVTEAVHREGGVLNKFMGDGLLALFGAPLPKADHAQAAARAALAARAAVEDLARERARQGKRPLRLGIGLNTGEVVAGCLGSKDRTEYSVIGHAVNLAARLEEQAAPGQILLGPDTAALLGEDFRLGRPQPLDLAGVSGSVSARELLEASPSPEPVLSPGA